MTQLSRISPLRIVATSLVAAVAVAALPSGVGMHSGAAFAAASTPGQASLSRPSIGVLQPTEHRAASSKAAGVDIVVLEAVWRDLQPAAGRGLDSRALKALRDRYDNFRRAGLQVVFSPGLQDVPAWVFNVDGHTRFVDQFGVTWQGQAGENAPDAVWNPNVRAAQRAYLGLLKTAISDMTFVAVRAGGLLNGELRFPDQSLPRHSYWAFGKWARAKNPVPGWVPGNNDPGKAKTFINWYLDSLVEYQAFIIGQTQWMLPGVPVQVLYPNVGLRPGQADAAAAGSLKGGTLAENNNTLSQGLDWARQVAALPKVGVFAYQTSIDRVGTGSTPQTESPVAYMYRVTQAHRVGIAGENQGGNSPADLTRAYANARQFGLAMMMIMNEADLYSGRSDRPSLSQVTRLKTSPPNRG